jgi:PKD repeat protein
MHRSAWAIAATFVLLISALSMGFASANAAHPTAPTAPSRAAASAVHASPSPAVRPSFAAKPTSILGWAQSLKASTTGSLSPAAAPPGASDRWFDINATTSGFLPDYRFLTSSTYDPVDQETVVFGGIDTSTEQYLQDTWVYRDGAWINITAQSATHPSPRFAAAMAFDAVTGTVILTGGCQLGDPGPAYPDTWSFTGGNWTNITTTAGMPDPVCVGDLSWDAGDSELVMWGGYTTNYFIGGHTDPDTWVYKDGLWSNVSATAGPNAPYPDMMWGGSAPDPAAGGGIVVFGGIAYPSPPAHPSPTYVFSSGTWTNVTSISGYAGDGAWFYTNLVYDAADHVPVEFGGVNWSSAVLTTTYALVNGVWTNWTAAAGPIWPSAFGTAAGDMSGGVVYVQGERLVGGPLSDTWELAGRMTSWASATPTSVDVGESVSVHGTFTGGFLPATWGWTFGDGGTSPLNMTTHTYTTAGTYLATFWAEDALGDNTTWTQVITVSAAPAAHASATPSPADVGRPVSFTGSVSGGTAPFLYTWYLGDGTWARNTQDPVHKYAVAKGYSAILWVNDSAGTSVSTMVSLLVEAAPTVTATATPSSATAGTSIAFAATPAGGSGGLTYLWNFTDGSWSTASAPTHAFATAGTYHVYLTVTDSAGATANASVTVTVAAALPPLTVSAVANVGGGTVGTAFTFTATASGGSGTGYTYAWSESPASGLGCAASTTATLSCTSTAAGSYTVTVTVTDSAEHTASANVAATVVTASSSSSSSSTGFSTDALAVMAVLAILVVLFGVMWAMKGKGGKGKMAPAAPAAAPAPATTAPAEPPAAAPAAPPPPPPAAAPPAQDWSAPPPGAPTQTWSEPPAPPPPPPA